MTETIIFLLGVTVGSLITYTIFRIQSGYGYFIVTKVPDIDDMYTVNVRLDPDQQLHKKKWLKLRRERSTVANSQK